MLAAKIADMRQGERTDLASIEARSQECAATLDVRRESVNRAARVREARRSHVAALWLACHTLEEIAAEVDLTPQAVGKHIEAAKLLDTWPKVDKLAATFADEEFTPPIYNVWSFALKTPAVAVGDAS